MGAGVMNDEVAVGRTDRRTPAVLSRVMACLMTGQRDILVVMVDSSAFSTNTSSAAAFAEAP